MPGRGWQTTAPAAPNERVPASFKEALLTWYRANGRRFPWREPGATEYVTIVSEILLQRTPADRVAVFLPKFVAVFPSWLKLARARPERLRSVLRPLGLWRRRATSLRALARVMSRRDGILPGARDELESLPGVGQYVANAVRLMCHDLPAPLLDVNMARVLERTFGPRTRADIRYDPWLQRLARRVVAHRSARLINWAILDLAAAVCTPRNPRCPECPVLSFCRYARRHVLQELGS